MKPAALKVVMGNPGRKPIETPDFEVRETPIEPPQELTEHQRRLWDRFINTAWWLTEHDAPKAYLWVVLQAQFESAPGDMVSAMISNLRAVGSELCMDSSARARVGLNGGKPKDSADKFFD